MFPDPAALTVWGVCLGSAAAAAAAAGKLLRLAAAGASQPGAAAPVRPRPDHHEVAPPRRAAADGPQGTATGGPAPSRKFAATASAASSAITEILRNISTANEGELDAALTRALTSVGGLTTVDRCFLIRLGPDGQTLTYEFQWCAEGIEAVPSEDQIPSLANYPWLRQHIMQGRPVYVEDIAALPMEAAAEKARWLKHGARSHLTVPIFDDGAITGLLSFHSVNSVGHWSNEDVRLLEILGQILVGAWQRRRAYRSLAVTNRLLTDIIDFLPDPTYVVDARGRVMAWNHAIEELTGVTKAAMVGRGDYAYGTPFHGRPQPLLIDHIGGRAPLADLTGLDAVERRDDTVRAEWFVPGLGAEGGTYLSVTASPLRDHEGHIVGAIESMRDITSRKRTELALRRSEERVRLVNQDLESRVKVATTELRLANAALREKEERYRGIIESLGDRHVFFSHDLNGRLQYVSPSYRRLLGSADLEDLTRRVREWLDLPVNRVGLCRMLRTVRGEKLPAWDMHVDLGDGVERILEVQSVPVRLADGAVVAVEGVARDVTEERRNSQLVMEARERLLETEKLAALGGMVAGLTHEMATPVGIGVTAATHLIQTCRTGMSAYEQGRLTRTGFETTFEALGEAAVAVHANLERAAELLRNFKQVVTDQSAAEVRTFDLGLYLHEIVTSLRPRFRRTGFSVDVQCPEGIMLHCDPGVIYRVISNLVMNSLTHGFDGLLTGRITIGVTQEGKTVRLEYRDDGAGMSPEQLAHIYEPFYTTKRGQGGTGLGMHIVHGSVTRALGGAIACRSRHGRGTSFDITIPCTAEVQHAQAQE
jgi:PAS domain S-box-containing protein